jgi:alkanesulfonate monooxygenase SsuD/methylene tetrahydromethanopterin reductase-like flavin-dependent oxidoreductase (luciferase family)
MRWVADELSCIIKSKEKTTMETRDTLRTRPAHPWVEEHRTHVGFGLQVFPIDTKSDPGRHLLTAGQLAETLGFDAFFTGDHPSWGLEGWMPLAALAVKTERIRLGSHVNCIFYRHPVLLARLAADLDQMSQGRLILGLGGGWDANEFANFGMPFPPVRERQEALEETITIIRGAWGAEPFTLHGRYFSTTGAQVTPLPLQQPCPPLLIAGGGERVTLRQVAQFADACSLGSFGMISGEPTVGGIRRKLSVLRQHCDALGRPFDSVLRAHFTGWLILAENETLLQAKLQRYFPDGLEQRFSGPWSGFALACTPEKAITYYQELVDVGIQYFIVQILDAADEETIRLLAEQVIPAIRE